MNWKWKCFFNYIKKLKYSYTINVYCAYDSCKYLELKDIRLDLLNLVFIMRDSALYIAHRYVRKRTLNVLCIQATKDRYPVILHIFYWKLSCSKNYFSESSKMLLNLFSRMYKKNLVFVFPARIIKINFPWCSMMFFLSACNFSQHLQARYISETI